MRGSWTRSRAVCSTSEGTGTVLEEDVAVPGARLFSVGAIGSVMVNHKRCTVGESTRVEVGRC